MRTAVSIINHVVLAFMAKLSVPTDLTALKPIVEAMIFASEEPLGPRTLIRLLFDQGTKKAGETSQKKQADNPLFEAGAEDQADTVNQEGEQNEEATLEEEPVNEEVVGKGKIGQKELREIIEMLNEEYEAIARPFRIVEIAGGFQFATIREYGEFVGLLSKDRARRRLSQAALETLAIVAYRQPVTKPEVESIRGVNCDQVLLSLLERNLIAISGRADTVGKPLLYATTDEFLRAFGLNSLSDLPKLRELEELMEEDAHSPTKPEVIPSEIADELLELAYEAHRDKKEKAEENSELRMQNDESEGGAEESSELGMQNDEAEENSELGMQDDEAEESSELGMQNDEAEENSELGMQDDEAEENSELGMQNDESEESAELGMQNDELEGGENEVAPNAISQK